MNNKACRLFFLTCLICLSNTARADIYSWTDESGIKHFSTSPPSNKNTNVTVTRAYKEEIVKLDQNNITNHNKPSTAPTVSNQKLTKKQEEEIDKQIQATWDGLWGSLKKGDIGAALQHHTPSSRKKYRQIYEALSKPGERD